MPDCFRCPDCTLGDPKRDTTYCMVVGPHAIGRDSSERLTFANLVDGTSNTIVFVERKTPVCWMAPEDVTLDEAIKGINQSDTGIGSEHSGGVNFGFADGAVRFVKDTVDLELLKRLLTIDDNEIASGEMISQ